jgi:hypothetical protein
MAGEDSVAGDTRQRRRVLMGALLIAALLGSAMLIFFLDSLAARLQKRYTIVAVMGDAPGLTDGAKVWLGGKEVGTVTKVALLPNSSDSTARVAADLQLPLRLRPQVRADSRIRLTSERLIGAAVVDIEPGSAALPALAHMDTIRQRQLPTPEQLTARATVVRAELDTVLAQLRTLTPPMRARLAATQRAFVSLDAAMAETRRIRADIAASPAVALFADPAFAASLERTREHAGALPAMIARLRDHAGGAGDVSAALQRLQLRADSLAAQLDQAAALMAPNSSAARFSQDSAVQRALNGARAELDSLLVEVRRNPLRFVF